MWGKKHVAFKTINEIVQSWSQFKKKKNVKKWTGETVFWVRLGKTQYCALQLPPGLAGIESPSAVKMKF